MKFRNLVVAATGALFLALTSFAQISAIEGDVKGEDGQPLVKAVIKLTRTDIKGSYKCDTNKKGHYFYNGLPLGTYNVTVEVDGVKGGLTVELSGDENDPMFNNSHAAMRWPD